MQSNTDNGLRQKKLDQIRPNSITVLHCVGKLPEDEINDATEQGMFDSRRDVIITVIENKRGGIQDMSKLLCTLNVDM